MKILYFFSNLKFSNITGQAGLMEKLIIESGRKHHTAVISDSTKSMIYKKKNIDFYLFKGSGDFKSYFQNIIKLLRYIKIINPDFLHINGILMTIYVCLLNLVFRKPYYITVTETAENIPSLYRSIFTQFANRSKQIFVSCRFIKNELALMGVNKNNIVIVHIGLDSSYIGKMKNDTDRNDILYFGDSSKDRGFDIVYEIARRIPTANFTVLVRFKYDDCRVYLNKMKKLKNVRLLFYPYKRMLRYFIAESKIILLPYRWMLMRPPISLIESMAMGKPVITTAMPGNEELVINGSNGIIDNFGDLEFSLRIIRQLLNSKRYREKLGLAAQKTAIPMYAKTEYSKIIHTYEPANITE